MIFHKHTTQIRQNQQNEIKIKRKFKIIAYLGKLAYIVLKLGGIMTQQELNIKIRLHKKWINNEDGGEMLDLCFENLTNLTLLNSDLSFSKLVGVNFSGANLIGVDFSGADISDANLDGAYIGDSKGILVFNKPNGRICYAIRHEKCFMIKAGCFWGTLDEFEAKAKSDYGDNKEQNYYAQIAYLKSLM